MVTLQELQNAPRFDMYLVTSEWTTVLII